MKAFAINASKAPLCLRDMPDPIAGSGEVVVAIAAASVNPLDVRLREGAFKAIQPCRRPLILGEHLAGKVVAVGPDTSRFTAGDEVFARADKDRTGTFAQRIAIAEADLATKPAGLDMATAAALPLVSLAAWQALVEIAQPQAGQRVLIHAGSGGVGTIAIQLAKHLGAHVATTVGTDNIALARDLGADDVIDYRTKVFEERVSGHDVMLQSLGPMSLRGRSGC